MTKVWKNVLLSVCETRLKQLKAVLKKRKHTKRVNI